MRRRAPLNVWPAFADLMTVLAVCALFTTLALSQINSSQSDLLAKLWELERENQELELQVRDLKQAQQEREEDWARKSKIFERQVREAATNEKMFKAIQEAQRFIDAISQGSGLAFSPDQSLQFGDSLVSFDLNSVRPIWKADGRGRLWQFCRAISGQLAGLQGGASEMRRLFVVQIEGHTDSTQCDDPDCNWKLSSQRAATFLSFMRQEQYCPGLADLVLRPVGYADTRPIGGKSTRRITVRLVPDYEGIIRSLGSPSEGVARSY